MYPAPMRSLDLALAAVLASTQLLACRDSARRPPSHAPAWPAGPALPAGPVAAPAQPWAWPWAPTSSALPLLPPGWEWPAAAAWQPTSSAAPLGFFGLPSWGAGNVLAGVQRPFDAQALRAFASTGNPCAPLEVGPGKWVTPTCGLPSMASSPNVPFRRLRLHSTLPASVDLRTQGFDGPVKDQQQTGVCWAFAVSSLMDSASRRAGRRDVVSPLHLVGTDAFQELHRSGRTKVPMVHEQSWPYDPAKACKLKGEQDTGCEQAYKVKQGSWRADAELSGELGRANASGVVAVVKVEKIAPITFDAIAEVLASGQAAYLAVGIDDRAWKNPEAGVIGEYPIANRGPHAVIALGYRVDGPRGREILVKNSWDTWWGDGGYAWVSENTLRMHKHDAFTVSVSFHGPPPSTGTSIQPAPLPNPNPSTQQPGPSTGSQPAPLPGPQPAPAPSPMGCAPGQLRDLVSQQCVNACPNGLPPAGGFCMPF